MEHGATTAASAVGIVLGNLALVAWGAAVWLGWYRSWAYWDFPLRIGNLGAPWIAVMLLVVFSPVLAAKAAGAELSEPLIRFFMTVGVGCVALGMVAAVFEWPSWALPPWYRQWRAAGKPPPAKTRPPRRLDESRSGFLRRLRGMRGE